MSEKKTMSRHSSEPLKKRAAKKRGKGEANSGSSLKRVDPNDNGDPRGSRAPRGDHPTTMHEKGDKNRPYHNK